MLPFAARFAERPWQLGHVARSTASRRRRNNLEQNIGLKITFWEFETKLVTFSLENKNKTVFDSHTGSVD